MNMQSHFNDSFIFSKVKGKFESISVCKAYSVFVKKKYQNKDTWRDSKTYKLSN